MQKKQKKTVVQLKPETNSRPDPGKPLDRNILPWKELCGKQKFVKSFSTVAADAKGNHKLYIFQPKPTEVFFPYYEDMEGYLIGYVVAYDAEKKKEVFRKNILNIDLIEWHDE